MSYGRQDPTPAVAPSRATCPSVLQGLFERERALLARSRVGRPSRVNAPYVNTASVAIAWAFGWNLAQEPDVWAEVTTPRATRTPTPLPSAPFKLLEQDLHPCTDHCMVVHNYDPDRLTSHDCHYLLGDAVLKDGIPKLSGYRFLA